MPQTYLASSSPWGLTEVKYKLMEEKEKEEMKKERRKEREIEISIRQENEPPEKRERG